MSELMGVIAQVSPSLKISWLVCLIWGLIQIEWYRRGHTAENDPDLVPYSGRTPHDLLSLRSLSE